MAFSEGSGAVYRPIRVLFGTSIYNRALQICWHESSYKSQIAVVTELLKLQQKHQIPSQVTAEDMTSLIFERSASSLRERLWEFEVEDFDEEEAKPLLSLAWSVNNNNKMRDVAFQAKMLLQSPEASPPGFQNPKVLSAAKDYAKILRERQRQSPSVKLLRPQEVVLEVVPRVLQGFWVLPPRPILNMASQRLSKMSVSVTQAVMDGVSKALTTMERQATFSGSLRDEMVESILTMIRQACPLDVLKNRIQSFSSVLLNDIVEVAVEQICGIFQSKSPEGPTRLTSTAEPEPEEEPELAREQDSTAGPALPAPPVQSAPPAPPAPPALPAPAAPPAPIAQSDVSTAVQEDVPDPNALPVLKKRPASPAPPAQSDISTAVQEDVPDPYALPVLKKRPDFPAYPVVPRPSAPLIPPDEPWPITKAQALKDPYALPIFKKRPALPARLNNYVAELNAFNNTNSSEREQQTCRPPFPVSSPPPDTYMPGVKSTRGLTQLEFLLLNLQNLS